MVNKTVRTIKYVKNGKVINIPNTPQQRKRFERRGYKPLTRKISFISVPGYKSTKYTSTPKTSATKTSKVSVVVRAKDGSYETYQNITPQTLKKLQTKYGYTVVKKVEGRSIKVSEVNEAIHQDIGKINVIERGKPATLYYSKAQNVGKTPEDIVREANLRRQKEQQLPVINKPPTMKDTLTIPSIEQQAWKEAKLSNVEKQASLFFGMFTPFLFSKGSLKNINQRMAMAGQRTMTNEETKQALILQYKQYKAQEEQKKGFKKLGIAPEIKRNPGGIEGSLYYGSEYVKGIARGVITLPQTIISLPISFYQLATGPQRVAKDMWSSFTQNPAGFSGEIIGTMMAFEGIRGIVGKVRGLNAKVGNEKLPIEHIEGTNLKTIKVKDTYISQGEVAIRIKGETNPIKGKIRIIAKGDKSKAVLKTDKQVVGGRTVKPQEIVIGEKRLLEATRKGEIIIQKGETVVYPYESKGISLRASKILKEGKSLYRSGLKTQLERLGFKERGIIERSPNKAIIRTTGISRSKSSSMAYAVKNTIVELDNMIQKDIGSVNNLVTKNMRSIGSGVRGLVGKEIEVKPKLSRLGIYPNPARSPRLLIRSLKRERINLMRSMINKARLKKAPNIGLRLSPYLLMSLGIAQKKNIKPYPLIRQDIFSSLDLTKFRKQVKIKTPEQILREIQEPLKVNKPIQDIFKTPSRRTSKKQIQSLISPLRTLPKIKTITPKLPQAPKTPKIKKPLPLGLPIVNRRIYFGRGNKPLHKVDWIKRAFTKMKYL